MSDEGVYVGDVSVVFLLVLHFFIFGQYLAVCVDIVVLAGEIWCEGVIGLVFECRVVEEVFFFWAGDFLFSLEVSDGVNGISVKRILCFENFFGIMFGCEEQVGSL